MNGPHVTREQVMNFLAPPSAPAPVTPAREQPPQQPQRRRRGEAEIENMITLLKQAKSAKRKVDRIKTISSTLTQASAALAQILSEDDGEDEDADGND